jgi:hypothetical protein
MTVQKFYQRFSCSHVNGYENVTENKRARPVPGRVAPGSYPPGAPTDPYVRALAHTVPPIMDLLRERTPSGPPSAAGADTAPAAD